MFDSAKIPGEILDLLVVDTATLKANPNLGKALAGIWYETMALMQRAGRRGQGGARGDGQAVGHRPGRASTAS